MKKKKLFAGILILGIWTQGLCGFGKMVDSAVVEKKDAVKTESEKNAAESEKGDAAEISDQKKQQEGLTVPEQVQAPETYQGVPVEVPDVEAITIKKAVPQEGNEKWLKLIEEIGDEQTLKSEEIKYTPDQYISGDVEINSVPYDILLNLEQPEDVESSGSSVSLHRDFPMMYIEIKDNKMIDTRTNIPVEIRDAVDKERSKESAEKLVQSFGLKDFSLVNIREKTISIHYTAFAMGKEGQKNADIKSFLFMYERNVNGVPLNRVNYSLYPFFEVKEKDITSSENNENTYIWGPETLGVTMTDDALWSFVYTEPMDISDYSDETLFLLPFEEIRQIYENTITEKYKMTDEVQLTKVKLGYMRIRNDKEKKEGFLIPVWDFYGTTKAIREQLDYSLLTVDARYGTVIERKYGY